MKLGKRHPSDRGVRLSASFALGASVGRLDIKLGLSAPKVQLPQPGVNWLKDGKHGEEES